MVFKTKNEQGRGMRVVRVRRRGGGEFPEYVALLIYIGSDGGLGCVYGGGSGIDPARGWAIHPCLSGEDPSVKLFEDERTI